MSFSIGRWFSKAAHAIAAFVGGHQEQFQVAVGALNTAATVAMGVAGTVLSKEDAAGVIAEIGKVQQGVNLVGNAAIAEADAGTLSQHAQNVSNLVVGLVTSGAIGIKNAGLQSHIADVANKANHVVGVLETAAAVAPVGGAAAGAGQ